MHICCNFSLFAYASTAVSNALIFYFSFISFIFCVYYNLISYNFFLGKLTEGTNPQLRKLNQKADNWKIEQQIFFGKLLLYIFFIYFTFILFLFCVYYNLISYNLFWKANRRHEPPAEEVKSEG